MPSDQISFEVFYNIPQPGFENKVEAIQTILKNYKMQIFIEGQQPNKDGIIAGSFIFIGVKK